MKKIIFDLTREQRYTLQEKCRDALGIETSLVMSGVPYSRFLDYVKQKYRAEFEEAELSSSSWGYLYFDTERDYNWFLLNL